jgi:hypothetical protein
VLELRGAQAFEALDQLAGVRVDALAGQVEFLDLKTVATAKEGGGRTPLCAGLQRESAAWQTQHVSK